MQVRGLRFGHELRRVGVHGGSDGPAALDSAQNCTKLHKLHKIAETEKKELEKGSSHVMNYELARLATG